MSYSYMLICNFWSSSNCCPSINLTRWFSVHSKIAQDFFRVVLGFQKLLHILQEVCHRFVDTVVLLWAVLFCTAAVLWEIAWYPYYCYVVHECRIQKCYCFGSQQTVQWFIVVLTITWYLWNFLAVRKLLIGSCISNMMAGNFSLYFSESLHWFSDWVSLMFWWIDLIMKLFYETSKIMGPRLVVFLFTVDNALITLFICTLLHCTDFVNNKSSLGSG